MPVTRTSATEKWLLNEIARIKGEQAKLDAQKALVLEQLHHIENLRKEQTRMLQALKASLHLVTGGHEVNLNRVVKAHREIGGRGTLNDWLKNHLQKVSPESVSAQTLMDRFCNELRVRFITPEERQAYFINSLVKQLRRLKSKGLVEQVQVASSVRAYEQAEISRLLTHGGTDAPLEKTWKPFIPEAPAGWRVTAFKRALISMGQGWSPQCENQPAQPGEWGVLKVGCVNGTRFDANENKALPPELQPDLTCVLRQGDVLMSRANTKELVGMAALVDEDWASRPWTWRRQKWSSCLASRRPAPVRPMKMSARS
jgi:hypothetical protein